MPLIPRYLDLLILLVERRQEAVPRRDIMDVVWSDVVVSDGALTQAVRTLRRALGDDPRAPAFIRTVSRHGYQFIRSDVVEEPDEGAADPAAGRPAPPPSTAGEDQAEAALRRLLDALGREGEEAEDEAWSAAAALHELGTEEALRRLDRRPGHPLARALLRDVRWDVPGAGEVPLLGAPGGLSAAGSLVALRLRRALRVAERRWSAASAGGALAGITGGLLGGLTLTFAPGSAAPSSVMAALAVVGAIAGGLGAAGVGAGLGAVLRERSGPWRSADSKT